MFGQFAKERVMENTLLESALLIDSQRSNEDEGVPLIGGIR